MEQALVEAGRLEADGHKILKLNTGNPAIFGFDAPYQIVRDMIEAVPYAHGYSDSRGIMSARRAVVSRYEEIPGFPAFDPDDVYLGNGVSELITMTMQALLDSGDEVLIPTPDYPLWTAMTSLGGGTPMHYRCDPDNDWQPDLEDIRSKVTDRTKAIVVINPNNPTGSVYTRETLQGIVDIAREHSLRCWRTRSTTASCTTGRKHISLATLAPDLLCLTFNGLSKTYRVAGYRSGWLVITGPKDHASGFIEGITLLASTRLCPNVPAQHAVQAALSGVQSIDALIGPTGRLHEQRDIAWQGLEAIPGVSCYRPQGALYAFPRLDPNVYEIRDDEKFIYDLLIAEHVLVVQGTGFNWPTPDHFRIVTLPEPRVLADAVERIGNFLSSYKQR
ncbi:pyridoxal phosphate-dependent aminotransferase [Microbacterium elymi]|uniref:alanine transaminase n=1 Tax=Microbacterium elymi TaxID=2909587 RepID=A0ABY5NKK6_9MICO|nr:pyridoxal phosphate-dependent aminotransferase [Microbacterium elymi]UUT35697.1 pyridoxal phosphate-dependent aminotransferase [Microbacterium elymi]